MSVCCLVGLPFFLCLDLCVYWLCVWSNSLLFMLCLHLFFFKQKTAYEMRISDWSSDVCSSDLLLLLEDPDQLFLALVGKLFFGRREHLLLFLVDMVEIAILHRPEPRQPAGRGKVHLV